jgi:hypothetical protein
VALKGGDHLIRDNNLPQRPAHAKVLLAHGKGRSLLASGRLHQRVIALASARCPAKQTVGIDRKQKMNRLAGGGLAITTVLTSIGLWGPEDIEPDVRRVNEDDSLLSYWPSEDYNAADLAPECNYFNFSVVYTSELCTHFVTTRQSSTPSTAFDRAIKCAALHKTECVLSPEIGLAVPAAFLVPPTGDIRMVLAPRILPTPASVNVTEKHIRVHQPPTGLLGSTRTLRFNSTLLVEFMDGTNRAVRKEQMHGVDAYCVQLLRLAFVPACWNALD